MIREMVVTGYSFLPCILSPGRDPRSWACTHHTVVPWSGVGRHTVLCWGHTHDPAYHRAGSLAEINKLCSIQTS